MHQQISKTFLAMFEKLANTLPLHSTTNESNILLTLGNETFLCALNINEMLTNAVQHAFCDQQNAQVEIEIHNSGTSLGLPSRRMAGFTIINMLTEQLHADLKVISNGQGTEIMLQFERETINSSSSNLL